MEPAVTVEFSRAAHALTRTARREGYVAPNFRSPPRLVGAARTIRRRPGGTVVAVRLRGRPHIAVLADMIEGVVLGNELAPPEADQLRAALWQAVGFDQPFGNSAIAGAA